MMRVIRVHLGFDNFSGKLLEGLALLLRGTRSRRLFSCERSAILMRRKKRKIGIWCRTQDSSDSPQTPPLGTFVLSEKRLAIGFLEQYGGTVTAQLSLWLLDSMLRFCDGFWSEKSPPHVNSIPSVVGVLPILSQTHRQRRADTCSPFFVLSKSFKVSADPLKVNTDSHSFVRHSERIPQLLCIPTALCLA